MTRDQFKICKQCGSQYDGDGKRFCSQKCSRDSHYAIKECEYCGRDFKVATKYFKIGKGRFCSLKCKGLGLRKHNVIELDSDIFYGNAKGYYKSAKTGRFLHHVIWGKNVPIPKGCVVHHKDGDVSNNDPDNLELLTWSEHTSLHNKERHARTR